MVEWLQMKNVVAVVSKYLARIISSRYLTWIILILFLLQALWVAVSFEHMVYDEGFHMGIIHIYTENWWPVIYNQPEAYDAYRDFAGEGSKLFHYLMSYPQRAFDAFDLSNGVSTVLHRFINIAMVTGGLYLFVVLFQRLKIRRAFINLTLIITTSLPILSLIAATVNYDNGLFLLTPLFFIYFVDLLKAKHLTWVTVGKFLLVGMVAALVKFTFLQIFAVTVAVLLFIKFRQSGKAMFSQFFTPSLRTKKGRRISLLAIFVIVAGLFAQTYIYNLARYGTPRPSCERTLSKERCLRNGVIKRNLMLLPTVNERKVSSPMDYTVFWTKSMIENATSTHTLSIGEGTKRVLHGASLLAYKHLLFFGGLIGLGFILYAWRTMRISKELKILGLISFSYVCVVLVNNYLLHYKYHAIIAIHSRYILLVAPIIIMLMVLSVSHILKKSVIKPYVALIVVALLTQGGGATPHLLQSDEQWYNDASVVRETNKTLQKIIRPFVIEK